MSRKERTQNTGHHTGYSKGDSSQQVSNESPATHVPAHNRKVTKLAHQLERTTDPLDQLLLKKAVNDQRKNQHRHRNSEPTHPILWKRKHYPVNQIAFLEMQLANDGSAEFPMTENDTD